MDLQNYFSRIITTKVVECVSGGGAGSLLNIIFEDRYNLFIYSAWRIEGNEIVLATSNDDSKAVTGRIVKTIKLLEGKTVLAIEMSPQFDLKINFDKNYCLRVFCDISSSEIENAFDTNWEFGIPSEDLYFKINNHFKIEKGKYY